MRGSRLLALVSVVAVTACTTATRPPDRRETPTASARLGTLTPSYPVGEQLSPGIEVIDWIPAGELTTEGSAGLDDNDQCRGIPPEVVITAGFDWPPAERSRHGCVWTGDLTLMVTSYPPTPMAKEIEEHLRNANPGGTDALAHLAWLRIDGYYAIERILATDPASSCWLSVDVGAPRAVFVITFRADESYKAIPADPDTGIEDYCPVSRKVAQNLLSHFFPWPLGGTATTVITGPTR